MPTANPSVSPKHVESKALIEARGLEHRYPGAAHDSLRGVDLHIRKGEILGLLGPNGAGKSTLLSILTGIIQPRGGDLRIAGLDPRQDVALRSISALVPQEHAFYPTLTGRENLAFLAGLHGLAGSRFRERLSYCVDVCRLAAVLDRRAGTYSGGLKRRLNLALGLVNNPEILYLDEPTVGIDAESRQYIVEAIGALRERGVTMIYTSHYMEEVEAVCDSITVINAGRIIASGALWELLRNLGERAIQLTLGEVADSAVRELLAPWSPRWLDERQAVLAVTAPSDLVRVMQALEAAGREPQQVRYGPSRLEAVYRQLLAGDDGQ